MDKPTTNVPSNWWESFFSDVVVDMWLRAVPEEQTRREVDFIQKMLQVAPPAKLLDIPCGGGRHSLALASNGYQVTGVDGSADFLSAARAQAAERKLSITWQHGNMRDIAWQDEFDGVFCFGNSFGYNDEEGNATFLKAVFRSLKPGARFILDYPMVAEALLPRFQARNWFQLGDIYFLEDERYDPFLGRVVTEYTFVQGSKVDKRWGSHRIYTCREVHRLLHEAGFVDLQAYGTLNEEPFKLGSEAMYVIATKKAL